MTSSEAIPVSLAEIAATYRPTAEANDAIWSQFTEGTNRTPLLREHRDWIEANRWGFGDRAFHFMWLLLLSDMRPRSRVSLRLLEIGVYKGQVLSLWALICRKLEIDCELTGISPLSGRPPLPEPLHRIRRLFDRQYNQDAHVGNLHESSDFGADVEKVFQRFGLPADHLRIVRGLSQDEDVWAKVKDEEFDLVYIDGGHRYEEVAADLRMYAPLVRTGGYLVVDDAGFFQPGTLFFKGFEPVSRAVREMDEAVWVNLLNVGHNRIFRKRSPDS